jgi:myosin-5
MIVALNFGRDCADHPDIFYFTNQGEAPVIPGVDDLEDLASTREAFTLLGVNASKQVDIFRIISGILHLGNILFNEETDDRCTVPVSI